MSISQKLVRILLTTLPACVPMATNAAICASPTEGQVAWFQAENSAISELGDLVGTPQAGVSFVTGKVGTAFRFDGLTGVLLPETNTFHLQDFSVEAWVRRSDVAKASLSFVADGVIFGGGQGAYAFALTASGAPFLSQVGIQSVFGNAVVNDLNWHHLAVTKAGAQVQFYVDGQPAGSTAFNPVFTFTAPFAVGRLSQEFAGNSQGLLGDLDEVGVFSRALSASEIGMIYQAGSAGRCEVSIPTQSCIPAPEAQLAWFRAENNAESEGNDLTGTLQNGVEYVPGVVGSAFGFNGLSGVLLPESSGFRVQDFSVEAWVRRTDLTRASHSLVPDGVIFGGGYGSYAFALTGSGAPFLSHVGIASAFGNAVVQDLDWHHLAVTKSGNQVQFYVDGQSAGSANFGPVFTFTAPFAVGSLSEPFLERVQGFLGEIDEVGVYSRPLLASEINAVFAAGSLGKCFSSPPVNLMRNGSFEEPAHQAGPEPFVRTRELPGWEVAPSPGAVDLELANSGGATAFEGGQSVDIEGAEGLPAYFIRQAVSVVPGQTYRLGFAYAKNPVRELSRMRVELAGTDTTARDFEHSTTNTRANPMWSRGEVEFTAETTPVTVQFTGNSPDPGHGMLLDDVTLFEVAEVSVANAGFEALTGPEGAHFDAAGKLLDGHYSSYPGFPVTETGFNTAEAIPGWAGSAAAGTSNPVTEAFAAGPPEGQNGAWLKESGHIAQLLEHSLQAERRYRLTVDVGWPAGGSFPDYVVGLYAGGQLVAEDRNTVPVAEGTFQRITVEAMVPRLSPLVGAPVEVRLGIPESKPGQVVFDHVRLTVESPEAPRECVPAFEGLAAWYRAEGNAADRLGQHPGSFTGARYGAGRVGQAFEFDGSNEVVVPDAPAFNGQTFTLEAWIFPTALDGAVDIIVNKESGGSFTDFQFELGLKGPVNDVTGTIPLGNVAFYLGGVAGLPDDYGGWADGHAGAPLNQWTHVALAVEPGAATVYVNGVQTRRVTGLTGTVRNTTGPLKIGSRHEAFVGPRPIERFNGRIDEFAFFTRALSGTEVAAVYAAGAVGKCGADLGDNTPPDLVLAEPAAGTVTDERFNLRGSAVDNVAVSAVTWTWNGESRGTLGLSNGQFAADGLTLRAGVNSFVVTASDVFGNQATVTREVILVGLRNLWVENAEEVQEGRRISFPITFETPGDVAGMTFRLNYDRRYLAEPQLEWSAAVGQSVNNVNTNTPNSLSASFALAGVALPAGKIQLGTLSFRARSVPNPLEVEIIPNIESVSGVTGNAITQGNWVVSGRGRITRRQITGDNNANQRLDIGDAVVISRLQVGLEERRSWDVGLNDVNSSGSIDSGDVVKVLRTVVGLDPQPQPAGGLARLARARAAVNPVDQVVLEFPDGPVAAVGQPYRVVVKVTSLAKAVSGVSFVLDHPACLELNDRQVGSLIPAGALPLWNTTNGIVQLAAVQANAWPETSGVAAVLTFLPKEEFITKAAWSVQLRQVELTDSGFEVRTASEVRGYVKSVAVPPTPPALSLLRQPDGSLRLEVRSEEGFEVLLEGAASLPQWGAGQMLFGEGFDRPQLVPVEASAEGHFWRARNP